MWRNDRQGISHSGRELLRPDESDTNLHGRAGRGAGFCAEPAACVAGALAICQRAGSRDHRMARLAIRLAQNDRGRSRRARCHTVRGHIHQRRQRGEFYRPGAGHCATLPQCHRGRHRHHRRAPRALCIIRVAPLAGEIRGPAGPGTQGSAPHSHQPATAAGYGTAHPAN